MSTRTPILRQTSWVAAIPQLVALGLAIIVGMLLRPHDGFMWGAAAYLAYSLGSRYWVPRDHRDGIALIKRQRFDEAIPRFQQSLEFFDRFPWIDRFRSIVLMSPSAVSYREMALANIAFCYTQIGDGKQARCYYEQCLARFPDSGLATAALRMMDAAKQTTEA
jgi:tetratricopeptide (TPR) repeat protein